MLARSPPGPAGPMFQWSGRNRPDVPEGRPLLTTVATQATTALSGPEFRGRRLPRLAVVLPGCCVQGSSGFPRTPDAPLGPDPPQNLSLRTRIRDTWDTDDLWETRESKWQANASSYAPAQIANAAGTPQLGPGPREGRVFCRAGLRFGGGRFRRTGTGVTAGGVFRRTSTGVTAGGCSPYRHGSHGGRGVSPDRQGSHGGRVFAGPARG